MINHDGWWKLRPGPRNTICDVKGVRVGHVDIRKDTARTGVTAILPHDGNLFQRPVPAGACILNGFGKSLGLTQLVELGEIETPILLTNTFGVPACTTTLIRHAIAGNPDIGRSKATVNPLVLECNDGKVNDIQSLSVTELDACAAIKGAGTDVAQGTVGAGSGMKTFGFAGGLGTSSRKVSLPGGADHILGTMVLSNFGEAGDLRVLGRPVSTPDSIPSPDQGSIIIVMATDAPLDARQLTRLSRRAGMALGRLGSYLGHQSGDIALAFSTANLFERGSGDTHPAQRLCESRMNVFFKAAVEATEEAVLNAIWHAKPLQAYNGSRLPSFRLTYEITTARRKIA